MTYAECRPGKGQPGDGDDQSHAGEVSSEGNRVTRLPVRSLVSALDHLDGAGLGEIDGRGALFVLPVVSEADSPRAREDIARRRLVALTGPTQRRLRARTEAARMQRLALASARSRSTRSASLRGVASG